ncbi:hypothetical protein [Nocardia otitidiscaviarum]|uniref:hypothetical protein n=1 Tax=Nocardia otitidiscaviarum TaxID=1823 RepID=UPI00189421DB|nr:hypothetical protein [Nocardia otitidiscaviarum]MBF6238178.1 hypothetical protein [Nocardia otitidiscaviarum]
MANSVCSSCTSALDHCHGTLVEHADRSVECTDPDCPDSAHARHTFIVDCGDIAGGCHCTHPESTAETLHLRRTS